jgi:oligopeptide/dipeptide ABC transporter ATP-binding protein
MAGSAPGALAPPLPVPILSLAITGHRASNGDYAANHQRIAAVIAQIFDAIAATSAGAPVRLHSLLADGADHLAANAALARGWAIAAPLPFGRALNRAINAHPATADDARRLLAGEVAHDAGTAARADAITALLSQAHVFELADADEIYRNPRHAYTKALLSAIPEPDPRLRKERILLEGDVPSPINPPAGSAFGHRIGHPRYEETIGMDLGLAEVDPGHWVAADPCCLTPEDWERVRGAGSKS